MAKINRQGVDTHAIREGDYIVYQVGPSSVKTIAKVMGRRHTLLVLENGRAIHPNYVLCYFKEYVPAKIGFDSLHYDSPEYAVYIAAARAAGKEIRATTKGNVQLSYVISDTEALNFASYFYTVEGDGNSEVE